ncbi:hypothetical protein [Ruminococcus sp.]|uniref:hypothetical protein n=1 Tax=Ruminococcus sp. TaxID=41978 RepID=UPI0025E0701B|nr:hypothetical protein [Ruminococcus sp.]
MENNISDITYAKAYRIYRGRGFAENAAKYSLLMLGLFLMSMLLLSTISYLSGEGFSDSDAADTFVPVWGGMTAMLRMFQYFEKNSPGGKFFRTVKGGFDTFVRADIMNAAECILTTLVFFAAAALLEAAGLIRLEYGINSCISAFIFTMLFVAVSMLIKLMGNRVLAGVCFGTVFLIMIGAESAVMSLTGGKIGAPHIAVAAAAAVILPVSLRAVHTNYRKKYWDN